ncbi:hypothetical protein Tco_0089671 [Tanacetum coccineum]
MSIKEMEDLKQQCLDETQSISNQIQIKDYRNEKIDIRYRRECEIMIDELTGKFNGMSIEINKKKELRQLEQAANLSTYTTEPSRRFNSFYDDDGFTKGGSPRTLHHDGMRILALVSGKGIEEFLTSSVEELVPIPREISSIDVPEEKSVTFSNPLFDSKDDFTSSDDESLSDEDNIESKESYVSNLDEPALLVTPLSDFNEDDMSVVSILEGFTNEPPLEENDALFDLESKEKEWKKLL